MDAKTKGERVARIIGQAVRDATRTEILMQLKLVVRANGDIRLRDMYPILWKEFGEPRGLGLEENLKDAGFSEIDALSMQILRALHRGKEELSLPAASEEPQGDIPESHAVQLVSAPEQPVSQKVPASEEEGTFQKESPVKGESPHEPITKEVLRLAFQGNIRAMALFLRCSTDSVKIWNSKGTVPIKGEVAHIFKRLVLRHAPHRLPEFETLFRRNRKSLPSR